MNNSFCKIQDWRPENLQERDDRLERNRIANLKDDEFENLKPTPFTKPYVSVEGWLQNKYIVLPDGNFDGFKIPANHLKHVFCVDEALASVLNPRRLD